MEIFNAVSKQANVQNLDSVASSERIQARETKKAVQESAIKNALEKDQIKEKLNETVASLNKDMEELGTNVSFGFNDKIESMYVDVKERTTGRLIRKIPSEEVMKLAEHFKEVIGLIFDKKG